MIRNPGARVRPILVLAVLLPSLLACAGKPMVEEHDPVVTYDSDGNKTVSQGSSISLGDDSPEEALARAGRADTRGEYQTAANMYEALYGNPDTPAGIREEALYRLGMVYGNVLNGRHDYERASEYLGRFLEEYPESEHAPSASANLDRFRELLGND